VFLCPRCRAGLCNLCFTPSVRLAPFLCPRCRAGLCDGSIFAIPVSFLFLYPRCRAGLCDPRSTTQSTATSLSFYALDVGRGFATLACNQRAQRRAEVSMPSMSGGALRRMPSQGTCDLGVWCPLRHPPGSVARKASFRRRSVTGMPLTSEFAVRQPRPKMLVANTPVPARRCRPHSHHDAVPRSPASERHRHCRRTGTADVQTDASGT
jgi:hypothetical protein